jgi:mannosyltransferase
MHRPKALKPLDTPAAQRQVMASAQQLFSETAKNRAAGLGRRLGQPQLSRATSWVVGITALAAIIRFSTLGLQSLWYDESWTAVEMKFGLLKLVLVDRINELTPPLYYVLNWGVTHVLGTGDVGLRSLSALAGTATVPIMYWAGRELATPRVGIVCAALCAVNPMLVWYSQEARSYSLLVMMSALSVVLFARALKQPSALRLALWAICGAVALTVHYFAVFLLIPEAIWLLVARRKQITVTVLAVWAVFQTGLALVPIALNQQAGLPSGWISQTRPLIYRIRQVAWDYFAGFHSSFEYILGVAAICALAVCVWLAVRRADTSERRTALIGITLGLGALAVPTFLALAGKDYVQTRNLLEALIAILLAVGAGLGARRAGKLGLGAVAAICVLSLAALISVDTNAKYQRTDWRAVAQTIGPATQNRAIVVSGYYGVPLQHYMPNLENLSFLSSPITYSEQNRHWPKQPAALSQDPHTPASLRGAPVSELVVIGVHGSGWPCWWGSTCDLPRDAHLSKSIPAGFQLVEQREVGENFTVRRYRASAPIFVTTWLLSPDQARGGGGDILLERGG